MPRIFTKTIILVLIFITSEIFSQNHSLSTSTTVNAEDIEIIINEFNTDSVRKNIQNLQDFGTRFLFADTRDSIADWIHAQFVSMGYTDVKIDSFQWSGVWHKNVTATLHSTTNSNDQIVVGAHHDCYSNNNPYAFAPGADDNASGTSAVLEMARVLKKVNYKPFSTIKFVTFGAEEYGLYGSEDYAAKARKNGDNIKLMINHDMISYSPYSVANSYVNVNYYSDAFHYRAIAESSIVKFTQLNPGRSPQGNSPGSDSYSFYLEGYPAVYFEEESFSPFYHSDQDVITNYNIPYCAEVIKASCATLLSVDLIPSNVMKLQVFDEGTGNSLLVKWVSDFNNFKVYVGKTSGMYDTVYHTTENSISLVDLKEGVRYFIGVSALSGTGTEGFINEVSSISWELPASPVLLTAIPYKNKIELAWYKNKELDVTGYNIYRSKGVPDDPQKINELINNDTTFTDNNIESGYYYYYSVKAVDSDGFESTASIIRSKAFSLDQGILIVDETTDGDGSLLKPSDDKVDEFFSEILSDYKNEQYDLIESKNISIADIGAYRTIIWCGNDLEESFKLSSISSDIERYLENGGNFIYTGYFPVKAITGEAASSAAFYPGSLIYDHFKISASEKGFGQRFIGASSTIYNDIYNDSTKTQPSLNYHLTNIEVLEAVSEVNRIFVYDSEYDISDLKGKYKGRTVGVENLSGPGKTLVLSFPLYYMNKEQAKSFINTALDRFNHPTPVASKSENIVTDYKLMQNYPNPFNPVTTIKYEIPDAGSISIKLYDVLGEEVMTIVDEFKGQGVHSVNLNASHLPSGIYYYRLTAGGQRISKKLMLLK